MHKLLYIDGCIRGADSRTRRLAEHVLRCIPDTEIETVSLDALRPMPFDAAAVAHRDALAAAGRFNDPFFDLANQFKHAEAVVLACPFWDMTVPSLVRAYLEHLSVIGLTFHYNEQGYPIGDCSPRRLLHITTRGGYVDNSDPALTDHASSYLGSLCRVLGVKRFDSLSADGLDIAGCDIDGALRQAAARGEAIAKGFWQ